MGKKKAKADSNNPEAHKELGNKAFSIGKFQESVEHYNTAIAMSSENPNHIYFANRANSNLELKQFQRCIQDCDEAIRINPQFIKSYLRKARAQHIIMQFTQALETARIGLELDSQNVDLKEIEGHLLEEVQQDKSLPKDHPERKKFDRLLQWMSKGGSEYSKLRLRFYESTHRGIHAACNIKLGDILLEVPFEQLITTPEGKKFEEAKLSDAVLQSEFRLNDLHGFLLTELYKKKEDASYESHCQPFLDILPSNTDDFPACFSDAEIKLLEGSFIHSKIVQDKINFANDYNLLCQNVPGFNKFEYKDFVMCVFLVNSRQFGINVDGKYTSALIPYADMLNHQNPTQTQWNYNSKKKCFQIEAIENIPFGQPVTDSYGLNRTPAELFLCYGFVQAQPENEVVWIELIFNPGMEKTLLQTKYLHQNCYKQKFDCEYQLHSQAMTDFLGFARFLQYNGQDTLPFINAASNNRENEIMKLEAEKGKFSQEEKDKIVIEFKGVMPKYDLATEVAAWNLIKVLVQQLLNRFPNTIEEDIQIIQKDDAEHNLTFNEKNCVLFRKREKQMLHYFIFCADKANELKTMSVKDAKQHINLWEGEEKRWMTYFKDDFCGLLDGKVAQD